MPTASVTPAPTPVGPQTPDVAAYVGATRITKAVDITYEEKFNDLGSASFSIPVNADTATERALVDYGTLVTFKEFGTVAFVMRVEGMSQATVAAGEEHDQRITYSGRSVLAELDRAIVYPPEGMRTFVGFPLDGLRFGQRPFTDVRYWNWASPSLDRTSWGSPVVSIQQSQSPPFLPPLGYGGGPDAWPDPDAYFLQPASPSVGGYHTARDWYLYTTFDAGVTYDIDVFAAAGANDSFEVWIDGVPVIVAEAKDGLKNHRATIALGDGTHKLVAKISHGGGTDSGNITGFICSVFKHFNDGTGLTMGPVVHTDSTWKMLNDPASPPGYTSTQIAAELRTEAQTRGVLTGWDDDFSDALDSAGDDAPDIVEFSTRVGTKVTDALRQLAENWGEFCCDFANNGGRRLQWFNIKGSPFGGGGTSSGRGSASGVTLTPGSNVGELTHSGSEPEVTVMLERWQVGYSEFPEADLIADYGRLEGFLSAPDVKVGLQAFYFGYGQIGVLGRPSESIEDLVHPLTEATQYAVGDTATIPNRAGASTSWRCMARAVSTTEDGVGTVTSQWGVARDDELARIDRWNRKNLGLIDGRSEAASPTSPSILESTVVSPVTLTFSTGGGGVTIVGDRGTPQRPDQLVLVTKFEAEADIGGLSGSTTVRVEVDGASIGTVTIASGDESGYTVLGTPVLINRANYVNVETTAAGGAQGLSVRVIGTPAL